MSQKDKPSGVHRPPSPSPRRIKALQAEYIKQTGSPPQQLEGGAVPLVRRRVLQLLVFWWHCSEDGGNVDRGGGTGDVTHLVDQDGGHDNAEQLQGKREVNQTGSNLSGTVNSVYCAFWF